MANGEGDTVLTREDDGQPDSSPFARVTLCPTTKFHPITKTQRNQ